MPISDWTRLSSCRVRLETDSPVGFRGETLPGRVCLHSVSQRNITLPSVGVWLWTGLVTNYGEDPFDEVAVNLELYPGEVRILPFALSVPKWAMLVPTSLLVTTGNEPASPLVSPKLSIPIWPELRYVDLARQLEAASDHDIKDWTPVGGGDGVFARLIPRPAMRSLFDSLGLELYPQGMGVYGTLVVDPQERTLTDILRAATGADLQRYRIRFTASQIPSASKEFERLLRPFMAMGRHLPIPSAGKELDELPRASQPPAPDATGLPVPDPTTRPAER